MISRINWSFVDDYSRATPPWGPVGYLTYKRTYARLTDAGYTEEWWQTCYRVVRSLVDDLDFYTDQDEVELLYDYLFNLKLCFSGRPLWQLGTSTVRRLGADSMQACWHVTPNEPIKPFTFTFDKLMLGGGVGFNIQSEYVYEMPRVRFDPTIARVDKNDVGFIVPDNREGWVELLRRTLEAFFFTGRSLTYSAACIRAKGEKISSFGGVASGPGELCNGIAAICKILSTRHGQKLRPIDVLDIMNIIGGVVVAGNVRRSAEIAIGDMDDLAYLNAKAFGRGSIPNWRSMSNNSVVCNDINALPNQFWNNYTDVDSNGHAVSECYGLVNLYNCRRYGRLADGEEYRPDAFVTGTNPCGEITLEPYEPCNLAELFLPNLENEEEFRIAAGLAYKVAKTIARYPFSDPQTQEVVDRNQRIGIGAGGFLQAPHLRSEGIYHCVYRYLEELDAEYSQQLGVNRSIKLTTVKPSGTLSLLAGVTPGAHPAFAPYYVRRIRFASNDPLVDKCMRHGFHVEPLERIDGSQDYGTSVVSFPVAVPKGTVCAKDMSAVLQLEYVKWLQTNWADNSVSVTVYYKDEELPEIREWLKTHYAESIKTLSFSRHVGHGFRQAPYEAISAEKYRELLSKSKPINRIVDSVQRDLAESTECSSGVCPVK